MNTSFSLFSALLLLLGEPDPRTVAERIVAAAKADERAMEHLDYLVNRIGPRLSGSTGLTTATEWSRDRLAGFGLDTRLQEWGTMPIGFERGPSSGRILAPVETPLRFGTDAWSAGTRGRVRGRALLVEGSIPDLDPQLVRGAWLLIGESAGCGGTGAAAESLAPLGISGVVRPAGGDQILTGGSPPTDSVSLPSVPAVVLDTQQWKELARRVSAGDQIELEFDIRNHFRTGPIPQYNVVAELRGRELPDELVIVGAHLDSWDCATGATDDGVGCAAVIEAARILADAKVAPKRTIRFVLWSGEEQGLLGSQGMVRLEPELRRRVSGVLVLDGGTNAISGLSAPAGMVEDLAKAFDAVTGLDPRFPFAVTPTQSKTSPSCPPTSCTASANVQSCTPAPGCEPSAECTPNQACATPEDTPGCSSDEASFLAAGVPAFLLEQSGRAEYHRTHHTELDTYDAVIPEYQHHNALVLALGAWGLAELDRMLPRDALAGSTPAAPGCKTTCPPR